MAQAPGFCLLSASASTATRAEAAYVAADARDLREEGRIARARAKKRRVVHSVRRRTRTKRVRVRGARRERRGGMVHG